MNFIKHFLSLGFHSFILVFSLFLVISSNMALGRTFMSFNPPVFDPGIGKELTTMPIDSLYEKAKRVYLDPEKSDSVPIYLTIGMVRYLADGEKSRETPTYIKSCNLLGEYYLYDAYDYANSYRYLRQALEMMQWTGIKDDETSILTNLASLHHTFGSVSSDASQSQRAIEYYNQVLEAAIANNDWRRVATTFINLCSIAFYNDYIDISQAQTQVKKSIPEAEPLSAYALNYGEAVTQYRNRKFIEAQGCFDKMRQLENRYDYGDRYQMLALVNKLHVFLVANQPDSVDRYVDICVNTATQTGLSDYLFTIYGHYADFLKKQGKSDLYSQYKLKAFEVDDSIRKNNTVYRMSQLENTYMTGAIRNFIVNKKLRDKQILFITILTILLLIMAVYYLYNYRQTKTRLEHLYQTNRQLANKEFLPAAVKPERNESINDTNREESEASRLYNAIVKTLNNTDAIYQQDFTVNMLADMMCEKSRALSHAISEMGDDTFTTLLTRMRIMEACRRIADRDNYEKYTIESISYSVGFKSRTNFSAAFKKHTGMTPSEYMRLARKDMNKKS